MTLPVLKRHPNYHQTVEYLRAVNEELGSTFEMREHPNPSQIRQYLRLISDRIVELGGEPLALKQNPSIHQVREILPVIGEQVEELSGGGGTPAWLEDLRAPSGDLPSSALKFTSSNYWDGSAEVVVGDLLGVNFLPESISASGMRVFPDTGNHPGAVGELFSLMAGNHTVVMEWESLTGTGNHIWIEYLVDAGLNAGWEFYRFDNDADITELNEDENDINPNYNSFVPVGVNRVVLTVGAATFSFSLNGDPTETGPRSVFDQLQFILFGHNQALNDDPSFHGVGLIRSIAVYPVQPDADLPALSELP